MTSKGDWDHCAYPKCKREVHIKSGDRYLCEYHYDLEMEKLKGDFMKSLRKVGAHEEPNE
jgi:hypothetical protein